MSRLVSSSEMPCGCAYRITIADSRWSRKKPTDDQPMPPRLLLHNLPLLPAKVLPIKRHAIPSPRSRTSCKDCGVKVGRAIRLLRPQRPVPRHFLLPLRLQFLRLRHQQKPNHQPQVRYPRAAPMRDQLHHCYQIPSLKTIASAIDREKETSGRNLREFP